MQISYIVILGLMLIPMCFAVCCKRDTITKCCGIGDCNVFCCNCDIGCNPLCSFDIGRKKRSSIFEAMTADQLFQSLDTNSDGFISMGEALIYLGKSGHNSTDLARDTAWFKKMDKNLDGKVAPKEFDHML